MMCAPVSENNRDEAQYRPSPTAPPRGSIVDAAQKSPRGPSGPIMSPTKSTPAYGAPSFAMAASVGVTISSMTRPVMASSTTGAGEYAPIPPVLGPRSSSKIVLWSWAAGRGRAETPSVITKKDASSPVMNSSTTTVRPAAPNASSSRQSRMAASASGSVAQIKAPLPAARPSALTTNGPPSSRQKRRAASASWKARKRAVGMPYRAIKSFAKALELSRRAAAWLGPKTDTPASLNRSRRPRDRGSSGPITASSTRSRRASATSSSRAVSRTGTQSAWAAMPGLPGAA